MDKELPIGGVSVRPFIRVRIGNFARRQKSDFAATFRLFECVKATGGLLCEHGAFRCCFVEKRVYGPPTRSYCRFRGRSLGRLSHFTAKGEVAGLVAR
jgi:hypothetical protein